MSSSRGARSSGSRYELSALIRLAARARHATRNVFGGRRILGEQQRGGDDEAVPAGAAAGAAAGGGGAAAAVRRRCRERLAQAPVRSECRHCHAHSQSERCASGSTDAVCGRRVAAEDEAAAAAASSGHVRGSEPTASSSSRPAVEALVSTTWLQPRRCSCCPTRAVRRERRGSAPCRTQQVKHRLHFAAALVLCRLKASAACARFTLVVAKGVGFDGSRGGRSAWGAAGGARLDARLRGSRRTSRPRGDRAPGTVHTVATCAQSQYGGEERERQRAWRTGGALPDMLLRPPSRISDDRLGARRLLLLLLPLPAEAPPPSSSGRAVRSAAHNRHRRPLLALRQTPRLATTSLGRRQHRRLPRPAQSRASVPDEAGNLHSPAARRTTWAVTPRAR